MAVLILIGPLFSTDSQGSDLIREAKGSGHQVTLVTPMAEDGLDEVYSLVDHLIKIEGNFESEGAAIKATEEIEKLGVKADAIFPANEFGVILAATTGEMLGLPSNGAVVGRILRDKYLQRSILLEHKFPSPKFWRFTTKAELLTLLPELTFPLVLKPVNGAGKVGVAKIYSASDLEPAFDQLSGEAEAKFSYAPIGEAWLLEEFIDGDKLTLELIAAGPGNVVPFVISETTVIGDHFIEIGHAMPSALPPEIQDYIRTYGVSCLNALGVRHGVVHLELLRRHLDGKIFVIELNGRIPGGRMSKLIEEGSGNNYYQVVLRTLLDGKVPPLKPFHQAVAVHWFCRDTGEVHAIDGFADVARSPGFVEKYCRIKVGQRLAASGDGFDRIGYSMNAGCDIAQAKRNAQAAASTVHIRYT